MLSYKKKIFIDRAFGTVAALIVVILTRLVGLILRRNHAVPQSPKVIAVAKFVGLGSIAYTGILCRALKKKFPNTELVYITSFGSLEFVKRMNYIDKVIYINDKGIVSMVKSTASLILRLWRLRPVLYFDMEVYSSWAAIIATLSLALNRYGFYRKSADFKKGLHTHMIFFNTNQHISRVYNQMALCVGRSTDDNLAGILNISYKDRESCSQILHKMGADNRPIILINTNASELLRERCWPAEKWIKYLEHSSRMFPEFVFLLTGASNEVGYVSELYDKLSPKARTNILNMAGRFGLGVFLALIEKASLLVTNDSGPLHLAIALGTSTVSIWGPGSPKHYGPISGVHRTIYEPVYCSPCLYHADSPPCEGDNACVEGISVSSVFEATKDIVELIKCHISESSPSFKISLEQGVVESPVIKMGEFNPVITYRRPKELKKHYTKV